MDRLIAIALLAAMVVGSPGVEAAPQLRAFTYQGFLQQNGSPVNGARDMQFRLFNSEAGGSQVGTTVSIPGVAIVNGVFNVDLSFPGAFTGEQRYLQVTVAGQVLLPRHAVLTSPVAEYALSAPPPTTPNVAMDCRTVWAEYQGIHTLSCPGGYTAVIATCNDGEFSVFKDSSMPPALPGGTLIWYLTPNASAATGVRCQLPGSGRSHASIRCCRARVN